MAGNWMAHQRELDRMTTLVLVGCKGSGKSGTGNSLLRRKAFETIFNKRPTICHRDATVIQDAHVLHVIDTPGGFLDTKPGLIKEDICRCLDMARFGIHAVLFVVSLQREFTKEAEAVKILTHYFGPGILDYIVMVFTVGDELGCKDEALDDWLALKCPDALKEFIGNCGNRRVIFENETKDESRKVAQVEKLLSLVSDTVAKNGGKPYTEFLVHHNKVLHGRPNGSDDETIHKLKEQLERLQEEGKEEIGKLREQLSKAQMETSQKLKEDLLRANKLEEKTQDENRRLREKLESAQLEIIKMLKEDLKRTKI